MKEKVGVKKRYLTCSVENLHIVHYFWLALCFEGLYTMKDEYNHQIATEGAGGGIPHGSEDIACLSPSLQSQKIHPTPTIRLPGPQNIYENRLSWYCSVVGGLP